jgi:colanic acid/amylovoran biosynthesis protein
MSRFYRKSQPLLLLPQALGPFTRADVADWCKKLFARADLICARDRQSLAYVKELGDFHTLRSYPDFTVSLMPMLSRELVLPENFAAIVPNSRMLDKTGAESAYPEFLRQSVQAMRKREILPVFILHDDSEDRNVLKLLGGGCQDIQVLTHSDPRVLKGMLGKAKFVIGSRFHALVSSLSQGVPCIGAGWSHKYAQLFADFACAEFLMADLSDLALLDSLVEQLLNEQTRSPVVARIAKAADAHKLKTQSMWEEVDAFIHAFLNRRT